jgi:hypothetical protein
MEKLIIKDSQWARGRTTGLNVDGRFCCLGLDALRCGIHPDDMQGKGSPEELLTELDWSKAPAYFDRWVDEREGEVEDGYWTAKAIDINDEHRCTDEERIEMLRPIFERKGIEIVWLPNE